MEYEIKNILPSCILWTDGPKELKYAWRIPTPADTRLFVSYCNEIIQSNLFNKSYRLYYICVIYLVLLGSVQLIQRLK